MTEDREHIIWYLFLDGDRNAFATIFKMHYSSLHNYGLKICGNTQLVEDVLQNFFIHLFENRKGIGEVKNIKGYIFISFRRALFVSLKKERVFSNWDSKTYSITYFDISQEEILINKEFSDSKRKTVIHTLKNLSPREREVIYLKYYNELKTSEIAKIMKISYQSVLNTLQKAFAKLRVSIELNTLSLVLKK